MAIGNPKSQTRELGCGGDGGDLDTLVEGCWHSSSECGVGYYV